MIKVDRSLGRRIRSAKRMMDLIQGGEVILYCPDQFGISVFDVNVAEHGFTSVMADIKRGRYFEEKICQPR